MSERQKAVLKPREVCVERIPDMAPDSAEWAAWCGERDIDPLNSGRRGWITSASTYIRGAEYLQWNDEGGDVIVDVLHGDEIDIPADV